MKSIAFISAALSAAYAAVVPHYYLMQNPSTGDCVVLNQYNVTIDEFTLTLRPCNSSNYLPVELYYEPSTRTLKTVDGYCLSPLTTTASNVNSVLAEIGLVPVSKCTNGEPVGSQWAPVANTAQWHNGYQYCLDYNARDDSLMQNLCEPAALINATHFSLQQYVFTSPVQPPPPVPPPPPMTCGQWSTLLGGSAVACGVGYAYVAPDAAVCAGDGSNCQAVCCAQVIPAQQTCWDWSGPYGGPYWACGPGYTYDAAPGTMCAEDGSDCQALCCVRNVVPVMQTCDRWSEKRGGAAIACGAGYEYVGEYGGGLCFANGAGCFTTCCVALPPVQYQTCGTWVDSNDCPTGSVYMGPAYALCSITGYDCVPTCCEVVPPPPPMQTCAEWSDSGNTCGAGYKYVGPDGVLCDADGYNCQYLCCEADILTTCGTWSSTGWETPTAACVDSGYTTYTGPDFLICNDDGTSDCASICCTTDTTCGAWASENGGFNFTCGSDGSVYVGPDSAPCSPDDTGSGYSCLATCCVMVNTVTTLVPTVTPAGIVTPTPEIPTETPTIIPGPTTEIPTEPATIIPGPTTEIPTEPATIIPEPTTEIPTEPATIIPGPTTEIPTEPIPITVPSETPEATTAVPVPVAVPTETAPTGFIEHPDQTETFSSIGPTDVAATTNVEETEAPPEDAQTTTATNGPESTTETPDD